MNKDLFFNGEKFISAKRAAEVSGYAPDHVATLARDGKVLAKRVGRTWYISQNSILAYKKGEPLVVPKHIELTLTPEGATQPNSKDLYFNGEKFISSVDAAKLVSYAPDHVAALARKGLVPGKMMGRTWYVSRAGILAHKRGKRTITYKKAARPVVKREVAPVPVAAPKLLVAEITQIPVPKPIEVMITPQTAAVLPIMREEVKQVTPTIFDSFFNQAVIAVVSVFVIGLSGLYILGASAPEMNAAFSARLADAGTASVLGSFLDKLSGKSVVRTAVTAPVVGQGPANESSITSILDGLPAVVPAPLAIEKLKADLRAEIDAYAKTRLATEVKASAPVSTQAPITIAFNQTVFKTEVLQAANAHTSAQSGSDVDLFSRGLNSLKTNGSFINPTIVGGTFSGVQLSGTFSGAASLTDLVFGNASGTNATTTNFFAEAASSTSLFASRFSAGEAMLGTVVIGDSTTTNATTTNFFAATASSNDLFSTNGSIGSLTFSNATGTNATTTNFYSATGTFDRLYVNDYQQNNGTFTINSNVATGDIFSVIDTLITNGTLIHQSLTANAGNGEVSKGQIINLTDNTTAGGGYSAFTVNVSGTGTGSGVKTLLDLNPGANKEIVFDSTGALRPTTDVSQNTTSIGTPSFYFKNGYFDTITANNISGTVVSGSTAATTWTIGSTQTGDVNEAIVFQRNSGSGNALLSWNASNGTLNDQRFLSVNYPFNATYTVNDASIATSTSLYSGLLTNNTTAGTQRLLSLINTGTGTTENGIYVNNTGTGLTAFEIAGTWATGIKTNNNSVDIGAGGLIFGNATGTSATTTNFYATNATLGNLNLSDLVFTNATGTSLFATTASTTNLFALKASINGDAFNVTSGGNVGIGITNPSSKLTVAGGDITVSGSTNGIVFANNQSIRDGGASGDLTLFTPTTGAAINFNTTNGNILFNPGTMSVGIGTSTPKGMLQVARDVGALPTTNVYGQLELTLTSNPTSRLSAGYSSTFDAGFLQAISGSTNKSLLLNPQGGNVGVGITNPGVPLDVNGAIRTWDGGTGRLVMAIGSNAGSLHAVGSLSDTLDVGGASYTTFSTYSGGWQERMRITNAGNVGIGTTTPATKLDVLGGSNGEAAHFAVSGTGYMFLGNVAGVSGYGRMGYYDPSNGGWKNLAINEGGGSVGIGKTNPAATLDVNGNAMLSGSARTLQISSSGCSTLQLTTAANTIKYCSSQFAFNTDQAQGFTFNGGSVIIGSTSGFGALNVVSGTTQLGAYTADKGLPLSVRGETNGNRIGISKAASNTEGMFLRVDATSASVVSNGMDLNLGYGTASGMTSGITVQNATGFVGIGTTSPSAAFAVQIPNSTTNGVVINGSSNTNYSLTINNGGGIAQGLAINGGNTGSDANLLTVNNALGTANFFTVTDGNSYFQNGNVGFGTTTPVSIIAASASRPALTLTKSNTGQNWTMLAGTNSSFYIKPNVPSADGTDSDYSLYIDTSSNVGIKGSLTVNGAGSSSFVGNVGIGVTNPNAKLQVNGSLYVSGSNNYFADTTGGYWASGNGSYATGWWESGGKMLFRTSTSDRMAIDASGNVGIGITNPSSLLHVEGTDSYQVRSVSPAGRQFMAVGTGGTEASVDYFIGGVKEWTAGLYGTDKSFRIAEGGGLTAPNLTILPGGNVGIGTTNPNSLGTSEARVLSIINPTNNSLASSSAVLEFGFQNSVRSRVGAIKLLEENTNSDNGKFVFTVPNGSLTTTDVLTMLGSNGNVGIGTTNPTLGKLQVSGNISVDSGNFLKLYNSANSANSGLGTGSSNELQIFGGGGGIKFKNSTLSSDLVTIQDSGNVGIGTTSPNVRLAVAGGRLGVYGGTNGSISAGVLEIGVDDSRTASSTNYLFTDTVNGDLYVRTDSTTQHVLLQAGNANQGNVGINTTTPVAKLSVTDNSNSQIANFDTTIAAGNYASFSTAGVSKGLFGQGTTLFTTGAVGIRTVGSVPIAFGINSAVPSMVIDASGNVGIGTTNPGSKLEVRGDKLLVTQVTSGNTMAYLGERGGGIDGGYFQLNLAGVAKVAIDSNGSSYFNGGNVGIGTTNPTSYSNFVGLTIGDNSASKTGFLKFSSTYNSGNGAEIYQNTSGTVIFNTNSSLSAMAISSSGNVGIGTTAPSTRSLFNVVGPNRSQTSTLVNAYISTSDAQGADIGGSLGLGGNVGGDNTPFAYISGRKENGTSGNYAGYFAIATQDGGAGVVERMRITSTGNVGIGTTNPQEKLDITGNIRMFTSGYPYIDMGISTSNYWRLINDNPNDAFAIQKNGVSKVTVLAGGNVGIGITNPGSILDVQSAAAIFKLTSTAGTNSVYTDMTNAGGHFYIGKDSSASGSFGGSAYAATLYSTGAYPMEFWTNSSRQMVITSGGNVGIGTTNPVSPLTVSGGTAMAAGWNRTASLEATFPVLGFNSNNSKWGGIGYDYSVNGGSMKFFAGASTNDITAGTNVMSLDSTQAYFNGNVGIGIANPGARLVIKPAADNTTHFAVLQSNGNTAVNVGTYAGGDGFFQVFDSTNSAKTRISANAGISTYFTGSSVGIGTNNPQATLDVNGANGVFAARIGNTYTSGNQSFIRWTRNGSDLGGQIFANAAGSVTYSAFTGAHIAFVHDGSTPVYGQVVTMDGQNIDYNNMPGAETVYGIKLSQTANDPAVIGTYNTLSDSSRPQAMDNTHFVNAVGNGDAWVIEGDNISIGDYLITSDVVGHAMKDTGVYGVSHVFAKAAENVDWSKVTDTVMVNGVAKKHKLISVLYTFADIPHIITLEARVLALENASTTGLTLDATSSQTVVSSFFAEASLALRQGIQALGQVSIIHNAVYAVAGIFDKIFAKSVHTDLICVADMNGETCVTRSQLDSMLAASGQSGTLSGVVPVTNNSTGTASSTASTDTASSTPATDAASSTPATDTASSTPSTDSSSDATATSTDTTVASAGDTTSVTP